MAATKSGLRLSWRYPGHWGVRNAAAENIGRLMARKHFYFVPYGQDDPEQKPTSLVAHFDLIPQAVELAVQGRQMQPVLL